MSIDASQSPTLCGRSGCTALDCVTATRVDNETLQAGDKHLHRDTNNCHEIIPAVLNLTPAATLNTTYFEFIL